MEQKLNDQNLKRLEKLATLKKDYSVYRPFSFSQELTKAAYLISNYDHYSRAVLDQKGLRFSLAGRLVAKRGPFLVIKDLSGTIQLFHNHKANLKLNQLIELLDLGDIVFVRGFLSKSNRGQLTLRFDHLEILAKALQPLPKQYYGFKDQEERYRKRYLDLIINEHAWNTFQKRFQIIALVRQYFNENEYLEVETPILHSVLAGGEAKPFSTFYNALKATFHLRVATELALKKLLVGGFERVYEIGRVFRNEGIDTSHNPEFTSIEFYQAYANLETMLYHTEKVIKFLASQLGLKSFEYQKQTIDLTKPFQKINMIEALSQRLKVDIRKLSLAQLQAYGDQYQIEAKPFFVAGHYIQALFEKLIEKTLVAPTFVCYPPLVVSPLAAESLQYPGFADRAELFINGKEYANMFTELNDPIEQKARFLKQREEKLLGNEEAGDIDETFIDALSYAMPPAGGCGIGIDRLVMLLTQQNSIREVLLFPTLKTNPSQAKD